MAIRYPDTIISNTRDFPIVYSDLVGGHKTVESLNDLYLISDKILSKSEDNSKNDALGLIWYVVSEGEYYQLINWENRKLSSGWKIFKDTSINDNISRLSTEIDNIKSNLSITNNNINVLYNSTYSYINSIKSSDDLVEIIYSDITGNNLIEKNIIIPSATNISAGVMSAEDKNKLDNKPDFSDLSNVYAEENVSVEDVSFATRELIKKGLFVDMWRSRLNKFSYMSTAALDSAATLDDGSQFGLNGMVMTYDEAVACYRDSVFQSAVAKNLYGHKYPASKTVFPTLLGGTSKDMSWMYSYCRNIEVLTFCSGYGNLEKATSLQGAFYGCNSLKRILGTLECFDTNTDMKSVFNDCRSLEDFRIKNLRESMSLEYSPKVNLDSLKYLVENAANVKPIVVTVHPDIFVKLTDEENTEWNAITLLAALKDISFETV